MASEDADPKIMKQVKAYQADSERAGGLLLQSQAAAILGITTPSLVNLVKTKKLDTFSHFDKNLVSADQVVAWGELKAQGGNNDKAKRKAAAAHDIEAVGQKLRGMMPWIAENALVDKSKN